MEFAFIFAAFGVKVSVVEALEECLMTCDHEICAQISAIAAEQGIMLYNGSQVEEILPTEDGACVVGFSDPSKMKKYIPARKVLLAVGRAPCCEGLGLENSGIALNDNGCGIKVNDKMQTNIPGIYAIGDVTNRVMLAHVASQQGIVAVNNIMGHDCLMDYAAVPNAIFTEPEIATVGVSEKAAQAAGIAIECGKFPFSANGKALALGKEEGFVKIITAQATEEIIGGAIIGPNATELIAEITLAVANRMKAEQFAKTIFAHPTTSEAVHEAALTLEGGSPHFAG